MGGVKDGEDGDWLAYHGIFAQCKNTKKVR